jgi:hypothetical protein
VRGASQLPERLLILDADRAVEINRTRILDMGSASAL